MRGRVNAIRTFKGLVADLRMKRIITLCDAEDNAISLFRILRYTRFRLQTLQEKYLMDGEGKKCIGATLCH